MTRYGSGDGKEPDPNSPDDYWRYHAGEGFENVRDAYTSPLRNEMTDDDFDWFWAVEQLEGRSEEKDELVTLLLSNRPCPLNARVVLADLLTRYQFCVLSPVSGSFGPEKKQEKIELIRQLCASIWGSEQDTPLSQNARETLARLLTECVLRRPPGRQPRPLYQRSNSELILEFACYEVYRQRWKQIPLEAALSSVAKQREIKVAVLRNAWTGRRGCTDQQSLRLERLKSTYT